MQPWHWSSNEPKWQNGAPPVVTPTVVDTLVTAVTPVLTWLVGPVCVVVDFEVDLLVVDVVDAPLPPLPSSSSTNTTWPPHAAAMTRIPREAKT
jgi:hypothetical protein